MRTSAWPDTVSTWMFPIRIVRRNLWLIETDDCPPWQEHFEWLMLRGGNGMAKRRSSVPVLGTAEILASFADGRFSSEVAERLVADLSEVLSPMRDKLEWHRFRSAVRRIDRNFAKRNYPIYSEASLWQRGELIYIALHRVRRANAPAWLFQFGAEQHAVARRSRPPQWRASANDLEFVHNHSTPVIVAVMCGSRPVHIQAMIECGATIHGQDSETQTALHHAIAYRFHYPEDADATDTAELLLRSGADVDARNAKGLTSLDLALRLRRGRFVKPLVIAGARPTSQRRLALVRRIADEEEWRTELAALEAAWSDAALRVSVPPATAMKSQDPERF